MRAESPECLKPERIVFQKDVRKKTHEVEGKIARGSNMMLSWCGNEHSTQSGDTELNL